MEDIEFGLIILNDEGEPDVTFTISCNNIEEARREVDFLNRFDLKEGHTALISSISQEEIDIENVFIDPISKKIKVIQQVGSPSEIKYLHKKQLISIIDKLLNKNNKKQDSFEEDKQKLQDDNIKDLIRREYTKGNIVVLNQDGIMTAPLKDIINQPIEGLLYDLNRNESVVITFINDPKWINDYASVQVIRELKKQLEEKNK